MKSDKWTDKELEYLRVNYPTKRAEEISAHLGRSVEAVYKTASKHKICSPRKVRRLKSTAHDIYLMKELRQSGMSLRLIASKFEISSAAVSRALAYAA